MDKADIALAVSLVAATFTGWQAYSGHISASAARTALRRKDPTFEISVRLDRPDWSYITIIARNHEPVSININKIAYRGRGVTFINAEDLEENTSLGRCAAIEPSLALSRREISISRIIGAAGDQATRSSAPHVPRPTVHLYLHAHGKLSQERIVIDWSWADGKRR